MAASIPALRVLIRDVKGSIRGYKISEPNTSSFRRHARSHSGDGSDPPRAGGAFGISTLDSFDTETGTRTVITGGHPHTRPLSPVPSSPRQQMEQQQQQKQQQKRPWGWPMTSGLELDDKSPSLRTDSESSVPMFPIQGARKPRE
jgi:hypothetical protein